MKRKDRRMSRETLKYKTRRGQVKSMHPQVRRQLDKINPVNHVR